MHAKKAGRIKNYLSYLYPLLQEKIHSPLNGTLEIFLFKGRYQLVTEKAMYSFEDLYSSYGKALSSLHLKNIHNILVLGLGLGSIPQILQKKVNHPMHITCVEFDPVIVQLAQKYYPDIQQWETLNIELTDALQYVMQCTKYFDLITVDLFIDTNVPISFSGLPFLEKLKSLVSQNGIILYSRMKENYTSEKILWDNLAKVFPEKTEIETEGNSIMYWRRNFNA
ncbi:MAG: spermidine synthase [Chitinophagales bacterium]